MRASAVSCFAGCALALALGVSGGACGQDGVTPTTASTATGTGGAGGMAGTGGGATGGGSTGGDAPFPPTSGIRLIIEPDGQNGAELVSAIQNAQTSVHMTMYILSDSDVVDALIAQKSAGHDVKVVLDETLPSGSGSNFSVFNQLKSAGVEIVWAPPQFTYTHEKCVILDGTEAWIMTMNAAYSSPHDNREYLAIDDIAADVAEAEAVFEGDFTGQPLTSVDGPLLVAPLDAHAKLEALIQSAKTSIDLEAEELSDDQIVTDLITAKQAGVTVRIVLSDSPKSMAQQEALNRVKAAQLQVVQLSNPYVHAKVLVVDATAAYVGSANFTYYSLESNRELGVLLAVPSEIQKIESTIADDLANGTPL
ncbi:MAG TPA: phospholipase D-like domain-containing protein [Minicystis sp.]|nr:phospholipase D-like domain-containing protein [Minicystis sp.]